jgi:hypothetical protein
LLKSDPANTPPAEDALGTAITLAQQQKARSFELRAALSLAKLITNGPTRRRPRRARVCAQGLFAEPAISRDRGGASASRRTDVMNQ